MSSVLQDWVTKLSWKEQTVLLCCLRGPDSGGSPEIKAIIRWIRKRVLENAAPSKTFMRDEMLTAIEEIAQQSPLILDMLPVHFFSHFLHALEVIAYRHPHHTTQSIAMSMYEDLCEYLHIEPEKRWAMTVRLKDEV